MASLLVLGSKPDPVLPPSGAFDAVACANASGYSAALYGLPAPQLTVMTALLTDGSAAGKVRLKTLAGLSTDALVYYPRPVRGRNAFARALRRCRNWKLTPFMLRRALKAAGYSYNRFVYHPNSYYQELLLRLTGGSPALEAQLTKKQVSSGVLALAVGIEDGRFERFLVSGFSFELTQSFVEDPNIALRGTDRSKHRDSDVAVLQALAARYPVLTTEPIVEKSTGLPILA